MLNVTIHTLDEESADDGIEYQNIDFVSLVNNETYGPPALVAPPRPGEAPLAKVGDKVLYINTNVVPMFEIERVD